MKQTVDVVYNPKWFLNIESAVKNCAGRSDIAALTPGTAVHAKGKQRVLEILRIATEVLAFEGYSAFTMRRIAARCGITLHNLQYYFKTKDQLFTAVVEQMQKAELESGRLAVGRPDLSAEDRFKAFIDYSIRDNQEPLIRGFQFELWALATRDPFAARCRDRMTKVYCDFILKLVKPLAPDLPLQEQRKKAAMILALLQGFPLIVGEGVDIQFPTGNLEKRLSEELLDFVRV